MGVFRRYKVEEDMRRALKSSEMIAHHRDAVRHAWKRDQDYGTDLDVDCT
jgi:hypothetical protein